MEAEKQFEILERGTSEIITPEDLVEKIRLGKPLRVKLGVDPTVPHVTLGWAVVLRKLRDFQRLGHTACLIIGDFTATIGDPSGKTKTRPQLTRDEVVQNVREVEKQLYKILDKERTEVYYNADWLGKMTFSDVIHLSSKATVARILERDDFQKRLKEERPIGMHEILYPLCQGYDSVAIKSDVELGGSDQKFNNLVGRSLQQHYGQSPQVVMLMPLLVGTDGKEKMSQSLGNYISIVDEPRDMYGKTMSIPDHLIESWFTLCTDVSLEDIQAIRISIESGVLNPRDAKRRLAKEIVALYYDKKTADEEDEYFVRTFSKREIPVEAPPVSVPQECVKDGLVGIAQMIHTLGLTESVSEARRLIKGGGVSLDGDRVVDPMATIMVEEIIGKVLKVGRHRFVTLVR